MKALQLQRPHKHKLLVITLDRFSPLKPCLLCQLPRFFQGNASQQNLDMFVEQFSARCFRQAPCNGVSQQKNVFGSDVSLNLSAFAGANNNPICQAFQLATHFGEASRRACGGIEHMIRKPAICSGKQSEFPKPSPECRKWVTFQSMFV